MYCIFLRILQNAAFLGLLGLFSCKFGSLDSKGGGRLRIEREDTRPEALKGVASFTLCQRVGWLHVQAVSFWGGGAMFWVLKTNKGQKRVFGATEWVGKDTMI